MYFSKMAATWLWCLLFLLSYMHPTGLCFSIFKRNSGPLASALGLRISKRSITAVRTGSCQIPKSLTGSWVTDFPGIGVIKVHDDHVEIPSRYGNNIIMHCTYSGGGRYIFRVNIGRPLSLCIGLTPSRTPVPNSYNIHTYNNADWGPFQCCQEHPTPANTCTRPASSPTKIHRSPQL